MSEKRKKKETRAANSYNNKSPKNYLENEVGLSSTHTLSLRHMQPSMSKKKKKKKKKKRKEKKRKEKKLMQRTPSITTHQKITHKL